MAILDNLVGKIGAKLMAKYLNKYKTIIGGIGFLASFLPVIIHKVFTDLNIQPPPMDADWSTIIQGISDGVKMLREPSAGVALVGIAHKFYKAGVDAGYNQALPIQRMQESMTQQKIVESVPDTTQNQTSDQVKETQPGSSAGGPFGTS